MVFLLFVRILYKIHMYVSRAHAHTQARARTHTHTHTHTHIVITIEVVRKVVTVHGAVPTHEKQLVPFNIDTHSY